MEIRSAKDLIVYQKAYQLAMAVFEVSKGFPPVVSVIQRAHRQNHL